MLWNQHASQKLWFMLINEQSEHRSNRQPHQPLCFILLLPGRLFIDPDEFITVWPRSSEVSQGLQRFTSESYVCYVGFGPADSSPSNWCKSPEDGKDTQTRSWTGWRIPTSIYYCTITVKLLVWQFFQILHKTFSKCRCFIMQEVALSLSWYKRCSLCIQRRSLLWK